MSPARAQLDEAIGPGTPRTDRSQPVLLASEPIAAPPAPLPSSEIGSLADLLSETRPHAHSGIVCPCCTTPTRRVVRVRPGGAKRWVAACAICAGKLLAGHPETLVGGHVRPRTKRAG